MEQQFWFTSTPLVGGKKALVTSITLFIAPDWALINKMLEYSALYVRRICIETEDIVDLNFVSRCINIDNLEVRNAYDS